MNSNALVNAPLMPSHRPEKKFETGSVTFLWNHSPALFQASLILFQTSIAFAFTVSQFLMSRTIMAIKAPMAKTTRVIGDVKTVIAALNSHVAAVAAAVAA